MFLTVLQGSTRRGSQHRTTTSWNAFSPPWPTVPTEAPASAAPWCSAHLKATVTRKRRDSVGVSCFMPLPIQVEGLNPCSGCGRQAAVTANSMRPSYRDWAAAGKQHATWRQDCDDAFNWTELAQSCSLIHLVDGAHRGGCSLFNIPFSTRKGEPSESTNRLHINQCDVG